MKKLTMGLMISAAVLVLGWLLCATVYTHTVSEEVTRLRRESRSDIVYLRTRVRELESELTSSLLGKQDPPSEAVDGDIEDESESETSASDTEAVTVPTHKTPETQDPTLDGEAPVAAYLLTEYDGVIGIFDAAGELVRTVNVFVMTLPEAEREALAVGIPVYSYEEMCALAEQYE